MEEIIMYIENKYWNNYIGDTDDSLNLIDYLKEEIQEEKFTLFSSDLIRAKQTAEPIAEVLGINAIFKKELRERNLGKCCGKSVK